VDGRVILGSTSCKIDKSSARKVIGITQEEVFVIEELDEEKLINDLKRIKAKGTNFQQ